MGRYYGYPVQFLEEIQYQQFSAGSRLGIIHISLSVLIAFGLCGTEGGLHPFVAWPLPPKVYQHKSNLLDIKIFLTHGALNAVGLIGSVVFTPLVTFSVLGWLLLLAPDGTDQPITFWRSALVTLIVVMAADFVKYWAHRMHHEYAPLWSFHAARHSADVLTPLTLSRVHPVESMIRNFGISVLVGIAQAVALFTFIGKIDLLTMGGANALYVLFNAARANLRHSHIWLSYGSVIEHIFISPALYGWRNLWLSHMECGLRICRGLFLFCRGW